MRKQINWNDNPPTEVGQTRRHNGRDLLPARDCRTCGKPFWPRRGQSLDCDQCKRCPYCGKPLAAVRLGCKDCQKGNALTDKQRSQLSRIHKNMVGENNPAKRPDVGRKISKAISGDNHPSRLHPEQWAAHIDKYRPVKKSKLEDIVATWLPDLERQFKVRWYAIDFAIPDKKIALEVQGCWHHCCSECFPNSPEYKAQKLCKKNDKAKLTYLTSRGWTVVYLWGHTIKDAIAPLSLDEIVGLGEIYYPCTKSQKNFLSMPAID